MKTIYFNGDVITMSDKAAESVATEDGKIIAVGNLNDVKSKAIGASEFDLKGKTLMPSFIDAHSHLSSVAASFLQVSLKGCENFDDIKEKIKDFVLKNNVAPGEWVTANGYDDNLLAENRHPDKAFADSVLPKNSLIINHVSGHIGVLNSLALKKLGADSTDGFITENAYFDLIKKVPMPDEKKMTKAYQKAQKLYASYGITTVQEGMMTAEIIPFYQYLLAGKGLFLDVVAYASLKDAEKIFLAFPEAFGDYHGKFKIGGYKIFLDGSPQGKTAWMKTPYLCSDDCGKPTMTDEEVFLAFSKAKKDDLQIIAHCNGDAAAEQLLTQASKVKNIGMLRPVIIHAQLITPELLDKAKELGFIPSFFVAHVLHWGETHIKNFGLSRASQISPANSALKRGMIFTFHQDSPVIPPDMLETVAAAVNRKTDCGRVLGEDEKIPVYEALKAVTINAAYQYFEENEKGSIETGKNADFVILNQNPLKADKEDISKIRVFATVKGGKVIYESNK